MLDRRQVHHSTVPFTLRRRITQSQDQLLYRSHNPFVLGIRQGLRRGVRLSRDTAVSAITCEITELTEDALSDSEGFSRIALAASSQSNHC